MDTLPLLLNSELLQLLKDRGLQYSGSKTVLVNRILSECNLDELESTFKKRVYYITEKGHEIMRRSKFIEVAMNWYYIGVDFWTICQWIYENPNVDYIGRIVDINYKRCVIEARHPALLLHYMSTMFSVLGRVHDALDFTLFDYKCSHCICNYYYSGITLDESRAKHIFQRGPSKTDDHIVKQALASEFRNEIELESYILEIFSFVKLQNMVFTDEELAYLIMHNDQLPSYDQPCTDERALSIYRSAEGRYKALQQKSS
jgi:hypothetical protein